MNKYKRLALCIIFVLSICACGCVSRKIGENEKSLLLSINDIKANNTLPAFQTASCENYAGKKFINGSIEITYEFDSRKNPANKNAFLMLKSIITTMPSVSRADTSFEQRLQGYKIGLSIGNKEVKLMEDPALFTWGDENYSAYLTIKGKKLGTYVMTRKGNVIYTIMTVGFYINKPDVMLKLLQPKLKKTALYFK